MTADSPAARQVSVYADADAVAEATAARLLLLLGDAIAVRGRADAVLTGGTVGIAVLAAAARSPLATAVDWTSVHLWWGDERFVPIGHADRNEGQAQEAMLGRLPIPEENIHRMGDADSFPTVAEAAAAYDAEIVDAGSPAWDVAMFGMGPDGHVASLFPGHEVYETERAGNAPGAYAAPVSHSPKPPPERVTLTLDAINRAREVWIVAAGAGKADAVAEAVRPSSPLPAAAVAGTECTRWLIDAAAATRI